MLTNFFKDTPNPDKAIHMFTVPHLFTLILLLIVIYLIITYSKKIKNSRYEEIIRQITFIILFISEFSYTFIKWFNGYWSMPLHLCSLSLLLTLILLLTRNKGIFDIVFFTGFLGGLVSFIVPDNHNYGYDNIRFYTFYLNHTLIIAIPLYFKFGYGYKVTKDSMISSSLFVIMMWLINFIVNSLLRGFTTLKTNYMFTHELPEPLRGMLPEWPTYIFIFALIAMVFYIITYLLFSDKITLEHETQ